MRLHEWYGFASDAGPTAETVDASGVGTQFLEEIKKTGAVLSGRNTVEQADHWGGDHHRGVPIFVPSHRPPGSVGCQVSVGDLRDGWIASAMAQAKAAAGDSNVLVHGAYTTQTALAAGVLDELQGEVDQPGNGPTRRVLVLSECRGGDEHRLHVESRSRLHRGMRG